MSRIFTYLAYFTLLIYSNLCIAAPGPLANEPLNTSATAEPNIMLLLDNSGSMNHIVPDAPYSANTNYFNCPNAKAIQAGRNVKIYITAYGRPYFRVDGNYYEWGTSGNKGPLGYSKRCFKPNSEYNAWLYANLGNNTKYPSSYGDAGFSGNYLNWYFGSSPTSWGYGARNKPGTLRRIDIAKQTANNLVNDLVDVRMGLATYNNDNGGYIRVGVKNINQNRNALSSAINQIIPDSWTPIAEALHDIGRYFVEGHNSILTLHPDQPRELKKSAYSIFNHSPRYAPGISRSSPIQYFCQKNFVVLLTDGLSTKDRDISVNTGLTDYDGDCINRQPPCLSYDRKPNEIYDTDGSDYLDDVAGALYDIDLRPDLTEPDGQAVKNNIITYPIGFADKKITSAQLMKDTATNGGGTFLTASNANELADAFAQAAAEILAQVGSAAAASFSSLNLSTDTSVYTSQYNTFSWTGNLFKYGINASGKLVGPLWAAATELNNLPHGQRFIFTYNRDQLKAVPFKILTKLASIAQADLSTNPQQQTDNLGQQRLLYLRGNRGLEQTYKNQPGKPFRKRDSLLADIVHSNAVYVGIPASRWPDLPPFPSSSGNKYSEFKAGSAAQRTPMLYVGDNGGFLHGFRADNGREKLAYIPSNLFSAQARQGLHYLTDPNYQHRYYVDATPVVADAYVNAGNGTRWNTILVGGEGAGGRGYFALNITNPNAFSDNNANKLLLWEFTHADNGNLGFTLGEAVIARLNNGHWAAIFGNGYNNTLTGKAMLFIVYLDTPHRGPWVQGQDYIVITTKRGSLNNKNGLSSPAAVDLDGNGTADRVYAGDLFGNMWAFDLSSQSASSWRIVYGNNNNPKPLFRSSSNQPITAKPIIVKNPNVTTTNSNRPNVLVLYGTGQYLTTLDKNNTNRQSFYGIWDSGKGNLRRGKLIRQYISLVNGKRVMTDFPVPYPGSEEQANQNNKAYGWYINLPESGERVVNRAQVRSDIVFFNTLIPNAGTCSFGGTGWLMAVKVVNGGQPKEPVIDINNDDQLDDTDKLQGKIVSGLKILQGTLTASTLRGDYMYTPVSDGSVNRVRVINPSKQLGRISWGELGKSK